MHNKTWLVSIALASSFFGIFTQTSYAFTNLDAGANGQNTTNPAYDDASTGYNFTAPNVDFTIIGSSTTPFVVSTDAGRSIDNTANNAGDNLFTTGLVQFNGTIGASNAIAGLNVMGGVATLFGDVLNQTPINLYSSTIQLLNNVNLTGPVDSLSSTYFPSGTIVFINLFGGAATSTLSGNIGATNPLAYIVTVPIAGTQQVIFQTNTTINVATIQAGFGGIALFPTTFDLRDNTVVNGNFVSDTDNNNSIILNQTQINGNIGAQGKRFATLIMNPNKTANIDGDIFATNTIINQNGILNLAGNNSFFGTVNSAGALPATLTFEGNTAVNFDIGGTNPLSTVNFSGPLGSVATLNAFVYANAVNVNGGGTLLVMPSEFGFTLGGDLTISNGSTLHLQPSAVIETTNDFILTGAGNTLAVDLGGSRYVFGGVFADNQAVLDNNATIEILNPGFSPVRTDATALIVSGLPMAAVPQLVTNSLLTSVDAALINAGTRLELYIQSLPVHTYAKQSNTIGVATALDEIASGTSIYPIGPATGTLQNILDQLGIFTDEDSLNNALATLSPIVEGGI
ncbi:MAG: hypothetical protein AB7V32_10260, partial [Candidatus Berkiella sp.]